jgi:hypothetical protein
VRDKDHQLRKLARAMIDQRFIQKELQWLEQQAEQHPEQWSDRQRILMLTNSYQQAETMAKTLRSLQPDVAHTIFNLMRGSWKEDFELEYEQASILHRTDIEQLASNPHAQILIAPMKSIGRGFNILNNEPEPKAAFGTILFLTRPMDVPNDVTNIAQELNRYALAWAKDPSFYAWYEETLYQRAIKARQSAVDLRNMASNRYSYAYLHDNPVLRVSASTAGQIIQSVGRLLRGAVPFRAYFIDAAWSPSLAENGRLDQSESEETSLLTAVINILQDYAYKDAISHQLYNGMSEALTATINRDSN